MRSTKQLKLLRTLFQQHNKPLTARQVWQLARNHLPLIGQATVYRQLQAALYAGWLRRVDLPGRSAHYEQADQPHHHFFICRSCKLTLPILGCREDLSLLLPSGCHLESHELLLYGRCDNCLHKPND